MLYFDPDEEEKIEEKTIDMQNGTVNKLIVEIQQRADNADRSEDASLKNSTSNSIRSRALDPQYLATTLFNIAKICVFAIFLISLALILAKISTQEGTVVLPFEVSGNENISGIAIADQLTAELTQIQKIHGIKYDDIILSTNGTSFTTGLSTEKALGNREMVVPKAKTIEFGMGEIGSIDTGSGSLSIGRLVIAFQNLLPGPKSITTIRGSLQRYGSSTVLVGLLEGDKVRSWTVTRPSGNSEDQPYEMIRSLAFMIALDQQQTDLSVKTWEGLMYYTEALNAYHRYQLTGDSKFLYHVANNSLEAIRSEKGYKNIYDLLLSIESICIMIGKKDDALEYCDKTIELDPICPNGWINKGISLHSLGKYDEAIQSYNEAIRLDRNYALAWSCRGLALNVIGKYDEAIQSCNEAIRLDPKSAIARNNKGYSLNSQGKYAEAIEAYEEAIRLDPKYAIAWNNKGYSLRSQGKYDEAIEAYDEAIKLDPKLANAWNNKGCWLRSRGKFDEAIDAYDEAIKLDPKYAIAWNNKGYSLNSQGKYGDAVKAYDEAIKLNPKFAKAWNNKGYSLNSQGKYNEAIEAYNEAIKLDPKLAYALNGKGNSLQSQGKFDEAIKAYDEAIRLDPKYADAWNGKGNSLNSQGKATEAKAAFNKSEELGFKRLFLS